MNTWMKVQRVGWVIAWTTIKIIASLSLYPYLFEFIMLINIV
jgi:hypothetical protein